MNFEDFNTLVLLVGTNPLPNFVTAEYFLTTNTSLKTIILIHSEDNQKQSSTKKYADNLQELLKSRHGDKLDIKKVHLSDVGNIEKILFNLREQIKDILTPSDSVHFNYTGGTKAMGIHVYRWLEQYANNNNICISFSYLDARNFCIVSDGGEISEDLREKVTLNINEIIKLYGFEKKNNSNFKSNPIVEKIREMIKDGITDYLSSTEWEIKTKPSEFEFDYEFQMDAILVNGFQLIGIGYIDSNEKALCKGKGFEILARTRQIAGQESRAILITSLKEPQKVELQQEFEIETGGNILVLGAEDFKDKFVKFTIEIIKEFIEE
jgi:hypothetical protein